MDTRFFTPETLLNPYSFYDRMRREHPVWKTTLPGHDRDVYLVTSYDLVKQVFGTPEVFSSNFVEVMMQGAEPHPEAEALFEQGIKQGSLLLNLDEPEHQRYRALVSTVFTPRQASSLQPKMESIMDALIDAVIERGECDFINEIAVPYPIYLICDLVGLDRSRFADMKRWSDAFLMRLSQQQTKEQDLQAVRDILDFQRYLASVIAERRKEPRDDLISQLVQARVAGVQPLTERETLIQVQEISVAGNETTRNTLIGGLALLLQNPDVAEALRADLTLVPNAVEEILRLFAPVAGMWRIARCDTVLGGVEIPAGAIVMVRMESANRDPSQFADPTRLDPGRARVGHFTFGYGIHFCIGSMLARRELVVAFTKLLTRLPDMRIDAARSDLSRVPSVLLRATPAMHITFSPAEAALSGRAKAFV